MGARVATDYLVGQGHRRIAFVSGPPDHPDALQRLGGYKAALAAARIPFTTKLVVAGDYLETGGYAAANALLDSRVEFTAVFAANDQTAFGVMLALHRRGLKVPQDCLGGRLRRLAGLGVHDPAAHHRAQAHRRDRRARGGGDDRPDRAADSQCPASRPDPRDPGIDPSLARLTRRASGPAPGARLTRPREAVLDLI